MTQDEWDHAMCGTRQVIAFYNAQMAEARAEIAKLREQLAALRPMADITPIDPAPVRGLPVRALRGNAMQIGLIERATR